MSIERIISSIIGFPITEISRYVGRNFDQPKELLLDVKLLYKNLINENQRSSDPSILVVAGIPCSGKSQFINKILPYRKNYCVLQFDRIMEGLRLYNRILLKDSPKTAFSKCEFIARVFGYAILCRLIDENYNVIFEHSSTIEEHVELYKCIRDKYDYSVEMKFLDVELDVALKRNSVSRTNDRYTSPELIIERYRKFNELKPKYKKALKFV